MGPGPGLPQPQAGRVRLRGGLSACGCRPSGLGRQQPWALGCGLPVTRGWQGQLLGPFYRAGEGLLQSPAVQRCSPSGAVSAVLLWDRIQF